MILLFKTRSAHNNNNKHTPGDRSQAFLKPYTLYPNHSPCTHFLAIANGIAGLLALCTHAGMSFIPLRATHSGPTPRVVTAPARLAASLGLLRKPGVDQTCTLVSSGGEAEGVEGGAYLS